MNENIYKNINQIIGNVSISNTILKMNPFCEEICNKSLHVVKTLPLKNLDFRVNFYFEEFLIFTVQMHGNHMEIFRKAFLQISNILFEILDLLAFSPSHFKSSEFSEKISRFFLSCPFNLWSFTSA